MMQEQDLMELAELLAEGSQVLSLYLNVDPHKRTTDDFRLELRKLLAQASDQGALPADIERVERFFEHEYDRHGRSVVCFACHPRKFWRHYELLVPMPSTVYLGRRPYIKPLSDVWDNYERFGVVMVDREGARALVYQLGTLEDTAGTLGAEVRRHKQGGWAAQKLQRYEDQEARHNVKDAAEWAQRYLAERGVRKVVLAGTDETLAQFREQASRTLDGLVIGSVSLDMTASPADVWERAYEVAQEAQRQAEAELLEAVITAAHKGGPGAVGLADTVAALQQGRAFQILLDPELHAPGFQCKNCGSVVLEPQGECPYCGGELLASADVVNLAVHRAVDDGLKVSFLERNPRLESVGGIAAALRY